MSDRLGHLSNIPTGVHSWTPVTDRGAYLRTLIGDDGGTKPSIRQVARLIAEREGLPKERLAARAETLRRQLHRYLEEEGDRDVNDDVVTALSEVLGVSEESWPPARPRQDLQAQLAELSGRYADLERRVKDLEKAPPQVQKPATTKRRRGG